LVLKAVSKKKPKAIPAITPDEISVSPLKNLFGPELSIGVFFAALNLSTFLAILSNDSKILP
jgi:hypothetical protein